MKVLMVSKACLTGTYQSKLSEIGQHPDVELAVMVPPFWNDPAGRIELEQQHTEGYQLWVEPLRLNGNYHLHHWPTLRQRIDDFKPDILHMDEEPYNLATWLALRQAKRADAKFLFFSWQNIKRRYPPPFSWMEQQVLARSDFGIMGNREAAEVFAHKGFQKPVAIIPQFGTDPDLFRPSPSPSPKPVFKIGYAGRLIHGKGVDLLLQAAAQLPQQANWELNIAGEGPEGAKLKALAQSLNLVDRVSFLGRMGSARMPSYLQSLNLLVLPSRTLPNWKEQFGRILVEAMACGVPVIGSDSGEIPHVIGDAGHIFAEGDSEGLAQKMLEIMQNGDEQTRLAKLGRDRVLACFTQKQIADQTVEVYRSLLSEVNGKQ